MPPKFPNQESQASQQPDNIAVLEIPILNNKIEGGEVVEASAQLKNLFACGNMSDAEIQFEKTNALARESMIKAMLAVTEMTKPNQELETA